MSAPALQVHAPNAPSASAPVVALRTTTSAQPPPKPVVVSNSATKRTVPPAVHLVAGGFAGSVGAIVTCPLEVVKTRLQSSAHIALTKNPFFYAARLAPTTGSRNIVKDIYRTEGIWAFWKGIGPTLAGVIPARAIYFATYNESKRALTALNNGRESSAVVMTSAIAAGTATTVTTSPIWLIKTRMQLQSSTAGGAAPMYRNAWDCFVKVVRNEGFFTLYRGLSASLIGISEGTIQWLIYEHLKRLRTTDRDPLTSTSRTSTSTSTSTPSTSSKSVTDWLDYFTCAATAKLTAATLTYPHEVIRTRMRETPTDGSAHYKYTGIAQSFRTIVREEGVRALYGGMGVHLLRVVPNSAIMFVCYESVVHLAQRWAVEAEAAEAEAEAEAARRRE